jgi:hypothetical protein
MRYWLLLLLTFRLEGAWNGDVLPGAHEGTMATRLVSYGDAFQERTFVAYRDAAGSLGVARFQGTSFTTATVWNGMTPYRLYASLSKSGTLLVTFWSNNRFRFV